MKEKAFHFPQHQKIRDHLGENIRLAGKRRKLTTVRVYEGAGMTNLHLVCPVNF